MRPSTHGMVRALAQQLDDWARDDRRHPRDRHRRRADEHSPPAATSARSTTSDVRGAMMMR